jgi:phage replication-related protein YjqB (UPF0714/DUF867 family)
MFDELLAHPGVREVSDLRSRFGFMAFHGGNLEKGTDDIAFAAAERSGASTYAIIQPPDLRWHLPSTTIDPAESPALACFLDHVEVVVTVHGYGREGLFTTLLLGGRNRRLAEHVGLHLRAGLPDYEIRDQLEQIPRELRGMHPENPVNRPPAAGVQVELPPRVRGLGPYWEQRPHKRGPDGRVSHTEALIASLAAAARSWSVDLGMSSVAR